MPELTIFDTKLLKNALILGFGGINLVGHLFELGLGLCFCHFFLGFRELHFLWSGGKNIRFEVFNWWNGDINVKDASQ